MLFGTLRVWIRPKLVDYQLLICCHFRFCAVFVFVSKCFSCKFDQIRPKLVDSQLWAVAILFFVFVPFLFLFPSASAVGSTRFGTKLWSLPFVVIPTSSAANSTRTSVDPRLLFCSFLCLCHCIWFQNATTDWLRSAAKVRQKNENKKYGSINTQLLST